MAALLVSHDLFFSSQLSGAAQAAGLALQTVRAESARAECNSDTRLILVDLTTPGLDLPALVRHWKTLPVPPTVIAFGPHVQVELLAAARAAGCDQVLSRGQLHRDAASLFAAIA